MKKIIIAFILLTMLQNCNSQEKIDLKELVNTNYVEDLVAKNGNIEKESKEMVTKLPSYSYADEQIENFKFGSISLEKVNDSYVKILVKSFSNPKIEAILISEKDNPSLAEKLNTYLVSQYGTAKIIEPEPTLKRDNIIFGNSVKKWIDSKKGTSVFLYKNYLKSNGKQVIGFSLHIISNSANYSEELSKELQTKKIIDWYNTRF